MATKVMKIVIFGAGSVGKSAIAVQFVRRVFVEQYDPTIEESYRQSHEVDGAHHMLEILDTAGTESFTTMRNVYMSNGHGFVLVFSLTAKSTIAEVSDIREQITRVKDKEKVPMVLVGNKCDLVDQREVPASECAELAAEFGCPFFETSAKLRQNIDEVFTEIVRLAVADNPALMPASDGGGGGGGGGGGAGGKKEKKSGGGCVLV